MHRGERHAVDIGGEHRRGTCLHGGDRGQAGARSQIEHALAGEQRRIVEDIAGQRLAAGPGKRPIGRRDVHLAQLFLGLLPDRERFFREMQQYLRDERRRQGARIGADEGFCGGANSRIEPRRAGGHFALAGFFAALEDPPMRQTSAHSAAVTGCTDRRELLTSTILASFGLALAAAERHRLGHIGDRAHVDAFPHAGIVLGIGMGERRHLHDADDLLAIVGVIEEGEVAELHGVHVVASLKVAHAVPGLALLAARFQHLPGEARRARTSSANRQASACSLVVRLRRRATHRRCQVKTTMETRRPSIFGLERPLHQLLDGILDARAPVDDVAARRR